MISNALIFILIASLILIGIVYIIITLLMLLRDGQYGVFTFMLTIIVIGIIALLKLFGL